MHLSVHGRHLDVGDALRSHIEESLSGIFTKYFGDAIEASVTIARDGPMYHARLTAKIGRGLDLAAEARADRPYDAFDGAADHLAKRLRRHKRRLRDHHKDDGGPTERARQVVLSGEPEAGEAPEPDGGDGPEAADGQPAVVAEMPHDIPTLTVGEAVMRLDLADQAAMMFRNAGHGGFNMVYRRGDGHIGWIDPQGNAAA